MTAQEKRAAVVAQAWEWLDFNEADGRFRAIIDRYNAGRPPGSYEMSYRDPWCAAFVSAVGMAAGCGDVILPHVNCDGMIAAYRERGQWIEDDGYQPEPGDLIFYDWQDGGSGDNRGSADHVGIVVFVDGKLIEVIEGNNSNAVKRRYIYEDGPFIRGFAVPGYVDDAADAGDGDKDPSTPADASAQDDNGGDGSAPDQPVGGGVPDAPQSDDAQDDTAEADASACHPERSAAESKDLPAALCAALPVLRFGCCGLHVVIVQGVLIARGFSCGPDGADGDMGYNTRNAVKRFQTAAGIPDDGVIGPETWAKLLGV